MEYLFASILRNIVSNILNTILILSLAEFKYSKKITYIIASIICTVITIIDSTFYLFSMTTVARLNLVIWCIVALGCKFLCKDSIMKWLFNLVTVLNVFSVVIVISYVLSLLFPYPLYANIVFRIALNTIFIIILKRIVYPLYRQVVDRWRLFLSLSVGIMLIYLYILLASKNIVEAITQNIILILLLTGLMFLVYGTMLWSFKSIIQEYKLLAEKEQMRLHEELLCSQLSAYEEFVETSKRHRHDLRHHNQIIMEYLKCGDVKGAEEYLGLYDVSLTESAERNYCKNYIANSVLCLYAQKAHVEEIVFAANADIPENISMTTLELGSMLSNILENALEACRKTNDDKRFITFTAEIEDESLKIELKNTTSSRLEIKNNLPVSTKKNGGTGTKSVLHIVESYQGMLNFRQEDDTFITQIILPAYYGSS